jgi:chromate reductase
VLKNAIDHASPPYGDNAWAQKPAGVIGTLQGAPGSAMAQQHLPNVLAYLDMPTLNQPEDYIRFIPGLIGANGTFGEETASAASRWMKAFLTWAERLCR